MYNGVSNIECRLMKYIDCRFLGIIKYLSLANLLF